MSLIRSLAVVATCCLLAAVIVSAKKVHGPSPTAPIFTNYYANVTETIVQAGQPPQGGDVTISWQMDGVRNMTGYYGVNIQPLVADFTGLTLYQLDYYRICQYTCTLDENAPCDDSVNGLSLCTYDQINRSQFVDQETIDGVATYHYLWQDPMVGIDMATHELWVDTEKQLPVQMKASFHPFGQFQANVTVVYNTFVPSTPPAANFDMSGLQYCQVGSEDQCGTTKARFARYQKMTAPLRTKILTEQ